jgi:hypothetical protein
MLTVVLTGDKRRPSRVKVPAAGLETGSHPKVVPALFWHAAGTETFREAHITARAIRSPLRSERCVRLVVWRDHPHGHHAIAVTST